MLFSDQFSLNFCFTSPSRGYTTNAVDLSNKINFTSEAFTSLQHNKIPKFHGARSLWINLKFPNVPNPTVTPANKSCGSKGKTPAAPPPETIELRSESINITKFLLAQFAYSAHFSVRRQSIHQRKGEGIVPDRRGKAHRKCYFKNLRKGEAWWNRGSALLTGPRMENVVDHCLMCVREGWFRNGKRPGFMHLKRRNT